MAQLSQQQLKIHSLVQVNLGMPFLKHTINGNLVSVIELGDVVHIGRGQENDIVVEDPTVSQKHARVFVESDTWHVQDSDSTNGILVSGKAVKQAELADGVVFSMGSQAFQFSVAQPSNLDKTLRIKKSWIPGVYYTE